MKREYKRHRPKKNHWRIAGIGKRAWSVDCKSILAKYVHLSDGPTRDATQNEQYFAQKSTGLSNDMKYQRYLLVK
jgi:hypothetical protein